MNASLFPLSSFGRAAAATALMFAAALGGSACGAHGAFYERYPDNLEDDLAPVLERLRAAPEPDPRSVAVGIADGGRKLFAVDLNAGTTLWQQQASAHSAPHIAGDFVVTQEDGGIFGRSLESGAVEFEIEDGLLHLVGAGGDGSEIAVALSTGGGVGAQSRLISVRNGRIAWEATLSHGLGSPTVAAGMVFAPWATQNVSVIDSRSGEELARFRIRDETVGTAITQGRDVYVGHYGLFRVDGSIIQGTRDRLTHFFPSVGELPGQPRFFLDAYNPPPEPISALHRVRLAWQVSSGSTVALADDNLYLAFYRLLFALNPSDGTVRWVYEHPHEIVGAGGQFGGAFVADGHGGLAFVRASDGARVWNLSTDNEPVMVRFRPGTLTPRGDAQTRTLALRDQLLSAAQHTDARLVPARILAVAALAKLEDPEVTQSLVSLCDDRQSPRAVRNAACTALGERTQGPTSVLRALERHGAFLEGTTPPPVGALARAAKSMQLREAVPLLLAHLKDPETASEDLPSVVDALGALGVREAAGSLRDFLRLYHAEDAGPHLTDTLGAAAEALVALEGPIATDTLEEIIGDPLTIPGVRERAREALAALQAHPEVVSPPAEEAAPSMDLEAGLPERITLDIVSGILAPVEPELSNCVREANRPTARVVLAITAEGVLESVSVAPAEIQACVEPLIRRRTFPANRSHVREQVTYTIRR